MNNNIFIDLRFYVIIAHTIPQKMYKEASIMFKRKTASNV